PGAQRQPAGTLHAPGRHRAAELVRGGPDLVRQPDQGAVRARDRHLGQRLRQPGTDGRRGGPAGARRDSAGRAAGRHPMATAVRDPGPGGQVSAADSRRRPAVRRAAGRRQARLAGHPPGRAAGRPDHSGATAMTTAGVRRSAPGAVPAPAAAQGPAWLRLVRLHLVSRPVPAAVARDVAGITGAGLLAAATFGGVLAWTGPMAYLVVTETALAASVTTPWGWPGRPPLDRGGAICACLVLAAGLALVTVRGVRESARDTTT